MKKLRALIVSLVLCTMLVVAISAAETFINPVTTGADPFVLKDDDGTYYLYVTSGDAYGYRVFSSTNLVEWEGEGYCLLGEDVYQTPASSGYYGYWAPELIKYEGTYYMVYTANHYLGIATSDSPMGPFTNDAENGGFIFGNEIMVIDGNFFLDDDGTMYLYFVTENWKNEAWTLNGTDVPYGNNVWGCEFDMETLTAKEDTIKLLIQHKSGDENVAEGPFMLKNGNTYYLTFSSGAYTRPDYAVCCATSSSPLGSFTRYTNPVLESDDLSYTDVAKEHLYGTAHHCFTTAPDGELYIVYHAHRNGWTYAYEVETDEEGNEVVTDTPLALCGPRVTCIDKAGFSNGVLWAGTNEKGTPSAGAQVMPTGTSLERETHYTGVFAGVTSLPTIYVASYDGVDTNAGTTYRTPVKTIEKAVSLLPNGGTVALIQDYVVDTYLDIPACNGPLVIKAAEEKDKTVLLTYKFLSINSDVYFDNIIFTPATLNNISVIECNFNNVVFGDGVSTLFTPKRRQFPYVVGGNWWYTGSDPSEVYDNFRYESAADVTSDADFSITVYSGTFENVIAGSMKGSTAIADTAVNGEVTLTGDSMLRPAKVATPSVKSGVAGITVSFDEVEYADKYQIFKDDVLLGYSDTNIFVDDDRFLGDSYNYSVRAYANGCCIGNASSAVTVTTYGDMDGDRGIELEDALTLIQAKLYGTTKATLVDLLVVFAELAK